MVNFPGSATGREREGKIDLVCVHYASGTSLKLTVTSNNNNNDNNGDSNEDNQDDGRRSGSRRPGSP